MCDTSHNKASNVQEVHKLRVTLCNTLVYSNVNLLTAAIGKHCLSKRNVWMKRSDIKQRAIRYIWMKHSHSVLHISILITMDLCQTLTGILVAVSCLALSGLCYFVAFWISETWRQKSFAKSITTAGFLTKASDRNNTVNCRM